MKAPGEVAKFTHEINNFYVIVKLTSWVQWVINNHSVSTYTARDAKMKLKIKA